MIKVQNGVSQPNISKRGHRQSGALSSVYVPHRGFQANETIFNMSVQFLAYGDDLDIVEISFAGVQAAFQTLDQA